MKLDQAISVARSMGWLSHQSPQFQDALCTRSVLKSYDKGRLLYHIDDTGPEMFCLVSGLVTISVAHPSLGAVVAHVMHPGDWFGEIATLTGENRRVTVHARVNCKVISIGRSLVDEMMRADQVYAYSFFDLLRRNSEVSLRSGIDLLIQDPRQRLSARLLTLGGAKGGELPKSPFTIPLSQEELALTSCLSRNTVNQVLNSLVLQNICALHYRAIEVLDAAALVKIVMSGIQENGLAT